jgi:pimeloyl-ACP methyl ester carboxylesterase
MPAVTIERAQRRDAILLPDKRTLGWSEWGPASGRPILFCTGAGMSGTLGFGAECLDALDVRLIAFDRPGLGRSTHDPEKTLTSWATDVGEVISTRRLEKPVAVGFSQGGPFAMALAAENLVCAVALVSAQDDLGHEAIYRRLPAQVAGMIDAARADPDAFEAEMAGIATNEFLWSLIRDMSAPVDRAIYEEPGFAELYRMTLREGFANGAAGYARDLVIALNPWPFSPEEISVPVDLWFGALDTSPVHSPDFGASLSARLPNASLNVVSEKGSAILWTHGREILEKLLAHP